uniref:Uncharacterized protein n=1 Tax=Megaselia scalaris TaxID=36166 RepID=T1GBY7_MEGSC
MGPISNLLECPEPWYFTTTIAPRRIERQKSTLRISLQKVKPNTWLADLIGRTTADVRTAFEATAAKSAIRLQNLGHFKTAKSVHRNILKMSEIGSPLSDYMGKAINFEEPVDVTDLHNVKVEVQGELPIYTDGSKSSLST